MKIRAPKPKMLSRTGDLEADLLIHAVRAKARLEKAKRKTGWKLAAACASDRRLLIGDGKMFKTKR